MPKLSGVSRAFFAVVALSTVVNVLILSGPIYMLQVFDRVLTSRSLETLLVLSIFVVVALILMGVLDACRAVILARLGDFFDQRLGVQALRASIRLANRPGLRASGEPLSDVNLIRQFLATPGIGSLFDAPWIPVFVALIWFVHPMLGLVALASAVVLIGFAFAGEIVSRRRNVLTDEQQGTDATEIIANAEIARTMALADGLFARLQSDRNTEGKRSLFIASWLSIISAASKTTRLMVQSAILGVGAYLVLTRELTPGQMIATSILLGRALAPIEVAIGSWRHFVMARQAWHRLKRLMQADERHQEGLPLPRPEGRLTLENVVLTSSQGGKPILAGVSIDVPAGRTIGIVGSSGAGKSSLGGVIAGVWQVSGGSVRLDGAELAQWDKQSFGKYVGYLPQQVELFRGTVVQNINRFSDAPLDDVMAAAKLAGIDDLIRLLPNGYQTEIGPRGSGLSGGQRQRIGLARAVFGNPQVVILDEPDSNMDQPGQTGLLECIDRLKQAGATVVIIAHRTAILSKCDMLLWLEGGRQMAFGDRDRVLQELSRSHAKPLRTGPSDTKAQS